MKSAKIILSAFTILCFYSTAFSLPQQIRDTTLFNKAKDSTILYLDWSKMTPDVKAKFLKIMAQVDQLNTFVNTVKIRPNENISRLIKENYAVVAEKNKTTHQALIDVLHDLNGLNERNTLIAGSFVKVPRLPIKQDKKSTKSLTQFFDPYIKQSYILATASSGNAQYTAALKNVNFSMGGLMAYKLSPKDLALVQSMIPTDLYRQLYGNALVTLDSIKIATVSYPERNNKKKDARLMKTAVDSTVIQILHGLDKSNFKKYYIFDNFNGSDAHGKKVLDVINDRFMAYGLDTTGLMIKPIPINYFDNLVFGQKVLRQYYGVDDKSSSRVDVEIQAELTQLKNLDTSRYTYAQCKDCIPEIYLHALFNYYYRDQPDVISSSFWADMFVRGVLPVLYDDAPTNLVTASLNDSGDLESRLKNILVKRSLLVGQIQPIKDYFNSYPDDGALIIGNRLNKDIYDGSYGKHVTTTGTGVGWSGRTIQPTDTGTSFATPDVAAKIYIAKAYWRSKQLKNINAGETRLRVLLATDIDTSFVGKFDSGGGVNMLKLLQPGNYAELSSSEIVPITNLNLNGAAVTSSAGDRILLGRKRVIKKDPKDGVCGLAYVDGQFYEFTEFTPLWRSADCTAISFSCNTPHGTVTVKDLNDFKSNFKQLIILNNP